MHTLFLLYMINEIYGVNTVIIKWIKHQTYGYSYIYVKTFNLIYPLHYYDFDVIRCAKRYLKHNYTKNM